MANIKISNTPFQNVLKRTKTYLVGLYTAIMNDVSAYCIKWLKVMSIRSN